MNLLRSYILPVSLSLSVFAVYVNMWFGDELISPFLFVDDEVRSRWFVFAIGWRTSLLITSVVLWVTSSRNIKWTAFLLSIYWVIDIVEIIGWYNTTPKNVHWIVFSVLLVYGFWRNDKNRTRGAG